MRPEDGSVTMMSLTGSHKKSSSRDIPSNTLSCPKLRLALTTVSKNTVVSYWAKQGRSKCTSKRPVWSNLYDFTLRGNSPAGRPWLLRTSTREESESTAVTVLRGRIKATRRRRRKGTGIEDLCVRDMVSDISEDSVSAFEVFKVCVVF